MRKPKPTDLVISIARDFGRILAPCTRADGPFSGEAFRCDILAPKLREAIERGEPLLVDLDGLEGASAAFLHEAFGGLSASGEFSGEEVRANLRIVTTEPGLDIYGDFIRRYLTTP